MSIHKHDVWWLLAVLTMGATLQVMDARRKLKEVCSELLRQVRQQMATTNGAKPAGKLERGVAPGSFLHHLASAKHHVSVRNGDDFTDTEILQQVHSCCAPACQAFCILTGIPSTADRQLFACMGMERYADAA